MSKPIMLISAPVATRSGYGNHSRDLIESLIEMDKWDIKIASLRWGDCSMDALDDNNPVHKKIKNCKSKMALAKPKSNSNFCWS